MIAGIRSVSNAFATKHLRIHRSCVNTIREHQLYCWNPEKQAQGIEEPLKQHGFTCDALRRVATKMFTTWRLISES